MEVKKIVLSLSQFFSINVIARILLTITGIIIARVLAPETQGLYYTVLMINTYGMFANLGILHAFGKQYPIYLNRKELVKAQVWKDTSFSLGMGLTSLVSVFFLVFGIIGAGVFFTPITGFGVAIIAIDLFFVVWTYFFQWLRSGELDFTAVKRAAVVQNIAGAIFKILFLYLWGLKGLFIGTLLTDIATLIYYHISGKTSLHLRISLKPVKKIFAIGIPLFIVTLQESLFLNIDKFLLVFLTNTAELGYYSIATSLSGFFFIIPQSLSTVLLPYMLTEIGKAKKGDYSCLRKYLLEPGEVMAFCLPVLMGAVYIFLRFFLMLVLPAYQPGLQAGQVLIAGIFFFCMSMLYWLFLMSIDDRRPKIIMGFISLGVFVILGYLFVEYRESIPILRKYSPSLGIAVAISISYFLIAAMQIYYTIKRYFKKVVTSPVLYTANLFIPVSAMMTVVYLIDRFVVFKVTFMNSSIFTFSVKMMVWGLISLPVLIYVVKRYNLLELLKPGAKKTTTVIQEQIPEAESPAGTVEVSKLFVEKIMADRRSQAGGDTNTQRVRIEGTKPSTFELSSRKPVATHIWDGQGRKSGVTQKENRDASETIEKK